MPNKMAAQTLLHFFFLFSTLQWNQGKHQGLAWSSTCQAVTWSPPALLLTPCSCLFNHPYSIPDQMNKTPVTTIGVISLLTNSFLQYATADPTGTLFFDLCLGLLAKAAHVESSICHGSPQYLCSSLSHSLEQRFTNFLPYCLRSVPGPLSPRSCKKQLACNTCHFSVEPACSPHYWIHHII